jgi:spore coat protein U-like protein
MKHWSRYAAVAATVFGLGAGSVATADDTANMTVTATVVNTCQLRNTPLLGFGALNPLTVNTDVAIGIDWACTNGFVTSIALGGGGSGNIAARTMASGGNALPYQLYTNAGRTTIFGDGTTGSLVPVTGVGYGTTNTVQVYGRVTQAAAQAAPAGAYTDTVLVTILF